jgi:uncharacterized RDD family membrane protein YckC
MPASLPRRLAAMLYDGLLLCAVLMLAAMPPVILAGGAVALQHSAWHALFSFYLLAVFFLFFGWFWTHGGQTLGMRAWRLRLTDAAGQPVSWRGALLRFVAAWLSALPLGLGWLWMLWDHERLCWHDRLSGTRLLLLPRST